MRERTMRARVIGGGLAGAEAAWQLARRGVEVELYEMRPAKMTEAHKTDALAELVCSNSLKSALMHTAGGLLKEEMRRLDSLTMRAADAARVPAGSALAVDREQFSALVTAALTGLERVRIVRAEVTEIPAGPTIVATGPLTSPALSDALAALLGAKHLYFYDAISPIVTAESIDMRVAFRASRYGEGGEDYLNLPLSRAEYERLVEAILQAETVPAHPFERAMFFEGCLPIEEMARRGKDTLAFGPMKPVGLIDPRTGKRPHAVVQLRQENREGTLYNLVGFQTKMTYPEQKRVFSQIPGLERAEFARFGSLHRNTFIDAPRHLLPTLQWRGDLRIFFAGQITGVEGYVESAATGLLAGLNVARLLSGDEPVVPPRSTALGSLLAYITDRTRRDFQPMNASFGLLPPLDTEARGRAKKELMALRALAEQERWLARIGHRPAAQPTSAA
ncbi:MAG TPA: methylenetetrahydrofolate--tRNA-(uracil(54)-C(5))-methyltransferase (FADH(2)-oxidizing) TrmFO [Candidatus Acidoferrales bacterium]|nr:methylenetetrahydrofolate--tRNA-(uracil(54)-C(5))-methyltransferase (FADH(2)-oxidizing) TrmFO [Candidatus Acidoferrales bacterium]